VYQSHLVLANCSVCDWYDLYQILRIPVTLKTYLFFFFYFHVPLFFSPRAANNNLRGYLPYEVSVGLDKLVEMNLSGNPDLVVEYNVTAANAV
jgi:hypothetical protein